MDPPDTEGAHDRTLDAVVRHADDVAAETWDDDVRGTLRFRTLFDSAETSTGGLSAGLAVLEPAGWLGLHRHPSPEIYHVLEGDGLLTVNGTRHAVGPGSSVFIPGGAPHALRTVGESLLRFLFTFPTDSLADVEYTWLRAAGDPLD